MLDNVPRTPLRDTNLQNVKQDLRENACELIKLFLLQDIEPLNARFIETISEELLAQARNEGRGARAAVGRIAVPSPDARADVLDGTA